MKIFNLIKPDLRSNNQLFVWIYSLTCIYTLIAQFSFYFSPVPLSIMMLAISFYIISNKKIRSSVDTKYGIIYFIGYALIYFFASFSGAMAATYLWIWAFFCGCWIMLDRNIKLDTFNCFIKLYCILLTISFVEYVFIKFFGGGILLGVVTREATNDFVFDHYIFNLMMYPEHLARFQSIMHEPGDIGTFNGLLIFALAGKKEYRFEFVVTILTGLLSMSLAFYVLLAFFAVRNAASFNIGVLLLTTILAVVLLANFNEAFNDMIVYRFLEGNADNRGSDTLKDVVNNNIRSFDIWGQGYNACNNRFPGCAGAYVFLYDYGLIGLTILFANIAYIYKSLVSKIKIHHIIFFAAFWASFYQRQYLYEPQIVMALIMMPVIEKFENRKPTS